MTAQQYEELVVAVASISYGVLALWRPATMPWPRTAGRKRVFAVVAIMVGGSIAVQTVLGA